MDKVNLQRVLDGQTYADRIVYSPTYSDDTWEYRHVTLPQELVQHVPKAQLMTEEEWRQLGVTQSPGWMHYMIHKPEPHVLLFRREVGYREKYPRGKPEDAARSSAAADAIRSALEMHYGGKTRKRQKDGSQMSSSSRTSLNDQAAADANDTELDEAAAAAAAAGPAAAAAAAPGRKTAGKGKQAQRKQSGNA